MTNKPRALLRTEYEKAAEAYLRSLPLEHFAQAVAQGTQHNITGQSFDLVSPRLPQVQLFGELLVQAPGLDGTLVQVVPDNMVVVCDRPIKADLSYDIPFQPVGPFWVLDYLSKHTRRKDYAHNFLIYERQLKVPYYLSLDTDNREFRLYHLEEHGYAPVSPNDKARHPIPELNLEVGLLDGWVRFWLDGQLVPLVAEMYRELVETKRWVAESKRAAEEYQLFRAEKARREQAEAEIAVLRAELERLRGREP
jgi:Uma2 family endonuclease